MRKGNILLIDREKEDETDKKKTIRDRTILCLRESAMHCLNLEMTYGDRVEQFPASLFKTSASEVPCSRLIKVFRRCSLAFSEAFVKSGECQYLFQQYSSSYKRGQIWEIGRSLIAADVEYNKKFKKKTYCLPHPRTHPI